MMILHQHLCWKKNGVKEGMVKKAQSEAPRRAARSLAQCLPLWLASFFLQGKEIEQSSVLLCSSFLCYVKCSIS